MCVVSLLSVAVSQMFESQIGALPSASLSAYPDAADIFTGGEEISEELSQPLVCNRVRRYYLVVKRALDFFGALFLLTLLFPVMILTALVVRMSSKGPVIFRQTRLTDGGRPFTMLKFRTMCQNAESKTGAVWASKNDARVTGVGRFLRKTRLDELPQLINVLKGEMSLIGPRPERPEFADLLKKELPSFDKRHMVKAGITGLAQVEHGYASCTESYRRKLALDLLYVKRCCLLLDLRIALRTIFVIFTGSGSR